MTKSFSSSDSSKLTDYSFCMALLVRGCILDNGFSNHFLNSSQLEKILGNKKFKRAHSSDKLFCKGVPVSKSLC